MSWVQVVLVGEKLDDLSKLTNFRKFQGVFEIQTINFEIFMWTCDMFKDSCVKVAQTCAQELVFYENWKDFRLCLWGQQIILQTFFSYKVTEKFSNYDAHYSSTVDSNGLISGGKA